jgi:uncharacterized protein
MKRILLILLVVYRWCVSPVLHALTPTGCRYQPSCSQYASEAIELHGAWRGGWLALKRLLRCQPFARGGFDPVPLPGSDRPGGDLGGNLAPGVSAATLHEPLP